MIYQRIIGSRRRISGTLHNEYYIKLGPKSRSFILMLILPAAIELPKVEFSDKLDRRSRLDTRKPAQNDKIPAFCQQK